MVLYRAVTSLSASDGVVKSSIIAGCGYIMQPVICFGYVMKWILKMIGLLMVSKASVSHDLPSPGWNSPVMLLSFVDAWNRPF